MAETGLPQWIRTYTNKPSVQLTIMISFYGSVCPQEQVLLILLPTHTDESLSFAFNPSWCWFTLSNENDDDTERNGSSE